MVRCGDLLVFLLLLFFTEPLHADPSLQGPPPLQLDYVRSIFTVEQGLPDNVVNAIGQTDNGLLWIGTEAGLASFDGKDFHQVRLNVEGRRSVSAVNALLRTSDGDLWVGTDVGLTVIPRAGQDRIDPGPLEFLRTGKRETEQIQALLQDRNGTVWVGTSNGLYRCSGRTLVPVFMQVYVNRISEAANGHLLFIGSDGAFEFDGQTVIRPSVTAAQLGVKNNQMFDVYQDRNGSTWYGTNAGIRATAGTVISSLQPTPAASTSTNHIYEDPQGHILVGTGIGLYQISGNQLLPLDTTIHARSIYGNEYGDLWIGTNGDGLVLYKPRAIRMYTQADGLPNDQPISVLSEPDGRLIVGSNCGFSIFNGRTFRKYTEKDGLVNTCVWALANDSQKNIWIGTYGGGLFRFRDDHFTRYSKPQGLADSVVTKIVVAHDGSLWIATLNGVSHMEGEHFRNYRRGDGLASDSVVDIYEDRSHSIWVTSQGGLDRLIDDRFAPVLMASSHDDQSPNRFVEDGLQNLYVTGVPSGLSRISETHIGFVLDDLNLTGMVETPDHQVWCSSRNGIYRISGESLRQHADNPELPLDYGRFDMQDGLLSSQTSVGSPNIVLSADDKLWVATVKGLAMLDLKRWPRAGRRPVIFLTGASVDGVDVPVGNALELSPRSHRTEIHMAAVDLDAAESIRMEYRMEGVDAGWQNVPPSRMAIYTNIPSGRHRLLIRSTDSNGVWGGPEFSYAVQQQAVLYERGWFRILGAALVIFVLALLYFLRVRVLIGQARLLLEERMQERERIARDLHDTFFQGIQGLLLRFNTGTAQLKKDEPARAIFEEALQQSDAVMLEGRELVLDLRSGTQEKSVLSEAFAEVGISLRSGRDVHFGIISHGLPKTLRPLIFEEAYRIGKEALTNAFRHARASEIELELNYAETGFRLRVRDNGIGLEEGVLSDGFRQGHWGLPGMRERTDKIGGHLELWSREGVGTEIELRLSAAVAYQDTTRSLRHRLLLFLKLKSASTNTHT